MILVAYKTEDQIQDEAIERGERPQGILKPPMEQMDDTGRIFAIVLAVGSPPRRLDHRGRALPLDPDWCELEFGDRVELTRHDTESVGGELRKLNFTWYKKPLWSIYNDPSDGATMVFAPEDGGPETYRVTQRHTLSFIEPGKIICRHARRAWAFHREGERPRPRPLFDKVLIKNMKLPERTAGGIFIPDCFAEGFLTEPLGEVVACGRDVRNVAHGDWALTKSDLGAWFKDESGQMFTIIRECDLAGRWDGEPSDEEKLAYSARMNAKSIAPASRPELEEEVDYDRIEWERNRPIVVAMGGHGR